MTSRNEATRMTQSRKNLVNAINELKRESIEHVNSAVYPNDLRNMCQFYLTKGQYAKFKNEELTLEETKTILIARIEKSYTKKLAEYQNKLNEIYSVEPLNHAEIDIIWSGSKTYYNKPSGEMFNGTERFTTGKPSGGNYDLFSTVTARLLNADNKVLRVLVDYVDENRLLVLDRNTLDYGVSYYCGLPEFCQGVGFNCHQRILEKLGYTVKQHTTYGRTKRNSDTITIEKN